MRLQNAKMEQDLKKAEEQYLQLGRRIFERIQRDVLKIISSDRFKDWKLNVTKK